VIPLYGFLEGDTMGLLILAYEEESLRDLAGKLVSSAAVRVGDGGWPVKVLYQGRVLDLRHTVRQAGLAPLDRFDVRRDVPDAGGASS
jgi:hypothetical protein